jgi:hypothetical protein
MMTMREMVIEYILFAFTDEELMERFHVLAEEVKDLPDQDLLEMYDMTLLTELEQENE